LGKSDWGEGRRVSTLHSRDDFTEMEGGSRNPINGEGNLEKSQERHGEKRGWVEGRAPQMPSKRAEEEDWEIRKQETYTLKAQGALGGFGGVEKKKWF